MKTGLVVMLYIATIGCSSHSPSQAADANPTTDQCSGAFDAAVDRTCAVDTDCALLVHPDCCGDVEIGVTKSGLAAAMMAETTYNSCEAAACGPRGCFHATVAEDGSMPGAGQAFAAVCSASSRCLGTVR
jgi:hypothetical protein